MHAYMHACMHACIHTYIMTVISLSLSLSPVSPRTTKPGRFLKVLPPRANLENAVLGFETLYIHICVYIYIYIYIYISWFQLQTLAPLRSRIMVLPNMFVSKLWPLKNKAGACHKALESQNTPFSNWPFTISAQLSSANISAQQNWLDAVASRTYFGLHALAMTSSRWYIIWRISHIRVIPSLCSLFSLSLIYLALILCTVRAATTRSDLHACRHRIAWTHARTRARVAASWSQDWPLAKGCGFVFQRWNTKPESLQHIRCFVGCPFVIV